ncbi:MAG TPA: hypothetical protein VK614_08660 [Allosphingosinicella sp.]|nr:hypothetical protein [Allosphingosinicella sp.]
MGKWIVPTSTLGGSGLLNFGLSYLAIDRHVGVSTVGGIDQIVTQNSTGALLAVAVSAASLVLAVWAIVAPRSDQLIASASALSNKERQNVLERIDRFLHASFAWYLSFAAFLLCYVFVISFDDLIDVTRQGTENPLHIVGLASFATVAADEAAPTLFLVGVIMLLSGMFSTLRSVAGLLPRLALAEKNRSAYLKSLLPVTDGNAA